MHTKTFSLPLMAIIVILRKGADGEGCDLNFKHDNGNDKDVGGNGADTGDKGGGNNKTSSTLVRPISNILVIIKVIKCIITTTLIKFLLRCVVPCCYCY